MENYREIDPEKIGIVGYSHGGFITLLSISRYPKDYKVAYAGVPVSDLLSDLHIDGDYQSRRRLKNMVVKPQKRILKNIKEDLPFGM